MTVLADNQFALGEDAGEVLMGAGTNIRVGDFLPDGTGDITAGDVLLPGEDGTAFGRDTYAGQTMTLELTIRDLNDPAAARTSWRRLVAAWNAAALRQDPGAVVPLRMKLPGSPAVRVYGRPRKYTPVSTVLADKGVIPLNLEFQASDAVWYDDVEQSVPLSLLPPDSDGGLSFPLSFPLDFAPSSISTAAQRAVNDGDLPTWAVVEFSGPISGASVEFVGTAIVPGISGALASDVTAVIDPRPWVRSATTNQGGNVAGRLTGPRLALMQLPPGSTALLFRGIDFTGNARARVRWRSAYSTP